MNRTRIQIALPDIVGYFERLPTKIHRLADLTAALKSQREFWRLAKSTSRNQFIEFLLEKTPLRRMHFAFPNRPETRYVWGEVHLLEVLLTLKDGSYFTHYTAMRLHGLTEQVPKTIYLNFEQPPHKVSGQLEQSAIDRAFSSRQRLSNNVIEFGDVRVCMLNGMHTGQLGVESGEATYDTTEEVALRYTNLERTMIDITVRPAYAGGVHEVLKAFELARNRLRVNSMRKMLTDMSYVYPYHQALGFYLEHAGFENFQVDLLREIPRNFDFYLSHQMVETDYIKEWRLFVPKGFHGIR